MKKLLILLGLLISVLGNAQKIIVTETNDTLVAITPKDLKLINRAFLDLKYTKLELTASDSIIDHQRKSLIASDSIISLKGKQIDVLKDGIKYEKKKRIRSIFFSGGIGLILGFITGLLL